MLAQKQERGKRLNVARILLPLVALASCAAPAAPPVTTARPEAASQTTVAPQAMVSAAHPLAAEAGRWVLAKGGSAADAAIATMLALTIVEPQSSGIGGGGFLVYHDAETNRTVTIDGRETAPKAATPALFLGPDGKPMPFSAAVSGGKSAGVPGNFRLAEQMHARFGKLPWATLFEPAIRLAEEGFAINAMLHRALSRRRETLLESPQARALFFDASGQPKPVGTIVRNPEFAALLRQVAKHGAHTYYEGAPARNIVATVTGAARNPSGMTLADIKAYQAKERPPVCGNYRVYRICGMGPPSSGGIAVFAILKMLEGHDLAALGPKDVRAWHLIAESERLAYADREVYVADPDFVTVPVAGLIDEGYLAERAKLIRLDRAMPSVSAGTPPGAQRLAAANDNEVPSTSHFAVIDAQGDVASLTSTIEGPFGNQMMVDGYFLNNELTDFTFAPEVNGVPVANRVEGGKRPRSSMSPTIVYDRQGRVVLAIGAAGGPTIIAQVAKALIGVLDWKLPVQDAIALPNIMGVGNNVRVEQGTALEAMAPELRALGHNIVVVPVGGKLNGIERVEGGWRGAADPRSEGRAVGL